MKIKTIAIALALCFLGSTVEAAKDVYFFGVKINKRDYIGGTVFSTSGLTAEVDMGYLHGLLKGQRLQIYRRGETSFEIVTDAIVTKINRKKSFIKSTTLRAIEEKDYVVFQAAQLDLWNRQKKLDYEAARRLVLTKIRGRYDTRETQTDREDLLVLRRSKSRKFDFWRREVARFRETQQIVLDASRTRRYWLSDGAEGIPDIKVRIDDLKAGQTIDELQLQRLRQIGVGVFDNPYSLSKDTVPVDVTNIDDALDDPAPEPAEPVLSPQSARPGLLPANL